MLENVTKEQIENEALNEFKKAWPNCSEFVLSSRSDECIYSAEDVSTAFLDGFYAGLLWWKAILSNSESIEKSELQKAMREDYLHQTQNVSCNSVSEFQRKVENENQLCWDW